MTREEAIAIRTLQVSGGPVKALELQEAIHVIERTTHSRCGTRKFKLPDLPRPVKEMANAALCFKLGLAIGKTRS